MKTPFTVAKELDKLQGKQVDVYGSMYGLKRKTTFFFFKENDKNFKTRILRFTQLGQ